MAAAPQPQPPADGGAARLGLAAFVLSLAWLGAVAGMAVALTRRGAPLSEALGLAVVVLTVVLPVALVWLGAAVLAAVRRSEARIAGLEAALAQSVARAQAEPAPDGPAASPAPALTLFVSRRDAGPAGAPGSGQGGLPLDPPPAPRPLDADELIRALDFPRDAGDAQGFDLLRRALHDPALADLIRSAEAVLSGLAAEGIELRDLIPDRARPEIWRAFAQGQRGPEVAALGGVRDRAVLARAAGRMRADPGFREAAHRFLRGFDRRLAALEPELGDAQFVRLAETRSARAFMILGRATGMLG